ncbi:MAG: pyridoxal-phosphate dependent enzyme [Gilvibacter sp.]
MPDQLPSKQDLIDVQNRIAPFVHRTPVLTSQTLNGFTGAQLFFKCENLQKMGAFKMRGAANAVASLTEEQKQKGVVTHSSGNFAQAVALAAKAANISAFIVMPNTAPKVKVAAVKEYGGQVTISGPTLKDREEATKKIITATGARFLHPSNQLEVILGQGTAAIELLEDVPDLDAIITPVGGGGLLAGSALAAHHFGMDCNVYAGEPANADDAYRALRSGKIETNHKVNTVADGLKTQLGDVNFPIILQLVDDIFLVSEAEIIAAMRHIWERMKIIVEPSSAVAFAAVLKNTTVFKDKKVGIVISGGNVDLSNLPF